MYVPSISISPQKINTEKKVETDPRNSLLNLFNKSNLLIHKGV